MQNTIKTILAARRKALIKSKPVFHLFAPVKEMELFITAKKLDCKMQVGLCQWLRTAGYGDIDHTLSFRAEYFSVISAGALAGSITFANDEAGNAYAFKPGSGEIYFISAHENGYAQIAGSFETFMHELVKRDYNLPQWRESLKLTPDES